MIINLLNERCGYRQRYNAVHLDGGKILNDYNCSSPIYFPQLDRDNVARCNSQSSKKVNKHLDFATLNQRLVLKFILLQSHKK